MTWYGWVWQHDAWHRVTGPHDTLSECSHALERVAVARKIPCLHPSHGGQLDARVAEELAKIDHLEQVAWEHFHASCQPYESRRVYTTHRGQTVEEYERRTRSGDPRFLKVISWCINARISLLGPFPGRRVRVSDVSPSATVEATDEERQAALVRIITQMRTEIGVEWVEPAAGEPPPTEPQPIADKEATGPSVCMP